MSDALRNDGFGKNKRYTYADYLEWEGPQRYQLINGEAYMMAPHRLSIKPSQGN
ncbi:MAG: Uma2 family endonuclease [Treponema sp.]|nr:Uma2 family endonuclease [Treponema sp.]